MQQALSNLASNEQSTQTKLQQVSFKLFESEQQIADLRAREVQLLDDISSRASQLAIANAALQRLEQVQFASYPMPFCIIIHRAGAVDLLS